MNTENETILHRHYGDDDTNKARQIDGSAGPLNATTPRQSRQ